jgi:hypothetical protein
MLRSAAALAVDVFWASNLDDQHHQAIVLNVVDSQHDTQKEKE